jgi:hypothetical protein
MTLKRKKIVYQYHVYNSKLKNSIVWHLPFRKGISNSPFMKIGFRSFKKNNFLTLRISSFNFFAWNPSYFF